MKPNFALTLSFDGIGLLHRSAGGWLRVGEVPLDHPDLANALQNLSAKAHILEPSGITTKLVIPNQQIRYLSFESDSRDIDILEAQVRNTLNGATPYHVSELAYDWSMTEGDVYVAAVAIETLTEAESFAVDHGFNPLSFAALAEPGAFQGEPFFGETVHAGEFLAPGETVERDEAAIEITGTASLPAPEPDPEPEPQPEPVAPSEPTAPPIVETDSAMPGFQSARSAPPEPDFAPDSAETAKPREDRTETSEPDPVLPATPEKQSETPPVAFASARNAPDRGATRPSILPQGRFNPTGKPATPNRDPQDSKAPPAMAQATPAARSLPPVPPSPETLEAVAQSSADSFEKPPLPIRPTGKPSAPASKHPGRLPFLSSRKPNADPRAAQQPAAGSPTTALSSQLRSGFQSARGAASGLAASIGNLRAKPAPKSAAERSALQAMEDERSRMTVFGERNPNNASTDTNPRFIALALTAALLFFLVAVAAWAALFLDDGVSGLFRSAEDVQVAEDEGPVDEAPAALAEPESDSATLPAEPELDTEQLADLPLEDIAPDLAISEELSPDEARARYAATGIWQMSPQPTVAPFADAFEDIYQTSLDPDLNLSDAVALPDVALLLPNPRPATPTAPLAPGEDNVARDERGFVQATPDGTLSPDGITIFAGAPPLTPPPTPERVEPEPEPEEVETTSTGEEAETSTESAGLRPRARPGDLIDAFERSNNGGRTLNELQDIRPRLRPQSAQEQALAEAGISTDIDADEENGLEDATDEAVATSLKPRLRPSNFAQVVEQTRETAASEPVSIEQRVAVSIPTTASVARAATERNQISLRRVNLIGVYGSADSRRALVRLPNGRYKKVKVGDRLDGGKVAAIGDGELSYVKRGQAVVLKMPKS